MNNPGDLRPQPATKRTRSSSIRRSILISLFGFAFLGVLFVIVISVLFGNSLSQRAQNALSTSLERELETNIGQVNANAVTQSDLVLSQAAQAVQAAAAAAGGVFDANSIDLQEAANEFWPVEEHILVGPEGQFLNNREETTSVFAPAPAGGTAPGNDPLALLTNDQRRDMQLSAYLELTFQAIYQTTPNSAALYFGTPNEVIRYYPNVGLGEIVPPDFTLSQRPWYMDALQANAGREPSQQQPVWSPVYLDAAGQGLVTTVAMPVYGIDLEAPAGSTTQQLVGVVGLDLKLSQLSTVLAAARPYNSGYSFLIDNSGTSIALPVQGYLDIFGRLPNQDETSSNGFGSKVSAALPGFQNVLEQMINSGSGLERVQGFDQYYYVAYAQLENTPWSLASVVAEDDVLASVFTLQEDLAAATQNQIMTRVLPAIFLLFVLLIVLGIAMTNRLVAPLETLAEATQLTVRSWERQESVQTGPAPKSIQQLTQRNDEIGSLATAVQELTQNFGERLAQREAQIAGQNQKIETGRKQILTALEVERLLGDQDVRSQKSSSGESLETLLQEFLDEAVSLVAENFAFYNVGIFLIDDAGESAVLQAASGDMGRQLSGRVGSAGPRRLRVGQQGIVGYVTSQGQARVAENVNEDRTYQADPLLPETRSEAVFPLRGGKRVIGALDVQSAEYGTFDEFTVMSLQGIADAMAGEIQRMRRRAAEIAAGAEQRSSVSAEAGIFGSAAQMRNRRLGYEYNPNLTLLSGGVREVNEELPDSQIQNVTTLPGMLLVPVRMRDEIVGVIRLESEDREHRWTADELAIVEATANQAALSVENARLLAETRRRAEREQAAAEITSQMRASLDLDTVLQTAVQEIGRRLNLGNVEVRLASSGEIHSGDGQSILPVHQNPSGEMPSGDGQANNGANKAGKMEKE